MIQKQPIQINFSQGVETKTDPFQLPLGQFLNLQNSVFTKGGQLQKRNGYQPLAALPNANSTYCTTFAGDLVALGSDFYTYSQPSNTWINQASINNVNLNTLSLIKNATNQSQADSAISSNGFICTVYTDQTPTSLSTPLYRYVIADAATGVNLIEPTTITNADATYGTPRVFILGTFFIIAYISTGPSYQLQYIAISTVDPTKVLAPVAISLLIAPSTHGLVFDAVNFNNGLYFAWNGSSGSGIKMAFLNQTLTLSATVNVDVSHIADIVTCAVDVTNQRIYVLYYGYSANIGYALSVDFNLHAILAPTTIIPSVPTHVTNLTGIVLNGVLNFYYEIAKAYSYDAAIPSNYILGNTLTSTGTLGSSYTVSRSVGLASKAFLINGIIYLLTVYNSPFQPSYFVMNAQGLIISRLAYGNARGYYTSGLPNVTVTSNVANFTYLYKDLIQAASSATNVTQGIQIAGIYSQTGVNLANVAFTTKKLVAAEIGANLNLNGGYLQAFDGNELTENNFFLYPDSVEATWSASGGSIAAQPNGSTNTNAYYYQVTYEWTDNQGNLFRSAPSIPVAVTTTGSGNSGSITINVPTLRLTLKNTNNPIKIVIYRWSVAQEVYYQVTSLTTPLLNNPSVDSVSFTDTLSDSSILGNTLLYTTGGVIENIGAPGFDSVFLFDSRLWGIVSEDKNLLWFSKQVIERTPVEMSDLLTIFVPPTIGAQGSTGVLQCGAAMDDKLVLFKSSAILYINGVGPDNTGANNGYSPPTFVTSTVGCSNQKSIVFQPQGLMFEFQSPSGNQIWLLGRNLTTQYIGAPVESFTKNASILSALNIPGTNQVRFTLSTGVTLVYDYFYGQWGTFTNVPAISSVLYQGYHTYINSFGQVFQESPGVYLDGTSPTLMSFTTSWLNLAGLQGYQRAYFFYLLGVYYSPHILQLQVAYDYNPSFTQQALIMPNNFSAAYGNAFSYGQGSPYGGQSTVEQYKVFFTQQRCQSFQLKLTEIYDPSYNVPAGAGFTLSGLDVVVGLKKGYTPKTFTQQVGMS